MCRDTGLYGVLRELKAARSKREVVPSTAQATTVEPIANSEDKKVWKKVKDGQKHIKVTLLNELDEITAALVVKAKDGGTAHLKLLWELGKLDEDPTAAVKRRAPSLSALLMREIREKEAAKKLGK
jgi:hypothetical protein